MTNKLPLFQLNLSSPGNIELQAFGLQSLLIFVSSHINPLFACSLRAIRSLSEFLSSTYPDICFGLNIMVLYRYGSTEPNTLCMYIHTQRHLEDRTWQHVYLWTFRPSQYFVHYMLISMLQNTTAQTPSIFSLYYRTKCRSLYSNIALIHRALCSYLSLNPDTMISNQIGLTYFSMFTFGHNSKQKSSTFFLYASCRL